MTKAKTYRLGNTLISVKNVTYLDLIPLEENGMFELQVHFCGDKNNYIGIVGMEKELTRVMREIGDYIDGVRTI